MYRRTVFISTKDSNSRKIEICNIQIFLFCIVAHFINSDFNAYFMFSLLLKNLCGLAILFINIAINFNISSLLFLVINELCITTFWNYANRNLKIFDGTFIVFSIICNNGIMRMEVPTTIIKLMDKSHNRSITKRRKSFLHIFFGNITLISIQLCMASL